MTTTRERAAGPETLGAFLRARRGARTPEAAGLVAGGPRQVPGLRREELALLAGVSTDYLVQVEQDRAHPSAQVLDALATALDLAPDARGYLHDLAGATYTPTVDARTEPDAAAARDLLAAWDDQPALVVTSWLDVVACTAAGSELYGGLRPGDNLARRLFARTTGQPDLTGPAGNDHERCLVGTLRSGLRPASADPRATALVEELRATSPRFATLWAGGEIHRKTGRTKPFVGADGTVLVLRQHVLTVADDARLQLWVYRPDAAAERP